MATTNLRKVVLHTLLAFGVNVPLVSFIAQSPVSANQLGNLPLATQTAQQPARIDRSGCIESYISGPSIDVPNLIDPAFGCYELRLNGEFVSLRKGWSLQQAIADLERRKTAHPRDQVEGYFAGFEVGYELYWDGVRVGYEPGWTLEQAIANLEWNRNTYPHKQVEGYFYGFKVGYELYWDGVRVGYEPGWTQEQALENLRWNRQTYPNKVVRATYNGSPLP